jgi:hypothetical protein
MGTIIVKDAVKREKGKLYYINANGDLMESKMFRGSKYKKDGVGKEKRI